MFLSLITNISDADESARTLKLSAYNPTSFTSTQWARLKKSRYGTDVETLECEPFRWQGVPEPFELNLSTPAKKVSFDACGKCARYVQYPTFPLAFTN